MCIVGGYFMKNLKILLSLGLLFSLVGIEFGFGAARQPAPLVVVAPTDIRKAITTPSGVRVDAHLQAGQPQAAEAAALGALIDEMATDPRFLRDLRKDRTLSAQQRNRGLCKRATDFTVGNAARFIDWTKDTAYAATAWTIGTAWWAGKGIAQKSWTALKALGTYGVAYPAYGLYRGCKAVFTSKKGIIAVATIAALIAIIETLNRYDALPEVIDTKWDAMVSLIGDAIGLAKSSYAGLPTIQKMNIVLKSWCEYIKSRPQAMWDGSPWAQAQWKMIKEVSYEIWTYVRVVFSKESRYAPETLVEQATKFSKQLSTQKAATDSALNELIGVCKNFKEIYSCGNGAKTAIINACAKVGVEIPGGILHCNV